MTNMFDEIIVKAKDVADVAGKKTGEVIELSKYKVECIKLNNDINKLYEKLGNAVYSMNKSGYENKELITSISSDITLKLEELSTMADKIAKMKEYVICKTCGNKNLMKSYYCDKCGSRIKNEFEL